MDIIGIYSLVLRIKVEILVYCKFPPHWSGDYLTRRSPPITSLGFVICFVIEYPWLSADAIVMATRNIRKMKITVLMD